jgi:hypothetical protein
MLTLPLTTGHQIMLQSRIKHQTAQHVIILPPLPSLIQLMDPNGRALGRELPLLRRTVMQGQVILVVRVMFHQLTANPSLRLRGPGPGDVHQIRSQRNRRRQVRIENLAGTFSPRTGRRKTFLMRDLSAKRSW